ncbi:hypothetical protein F5Y11DRAFT_219217 [Daldinia sp. FL1419]|nr:hypothetical protein F5Y11DRAFT_219217 [Daldinia sp. FL1419]
MLGMYNVCHAGRRFGLTSNLSFSAIFNLDLLVLCYACYTRQLYYIHLRRRRAASCLIEVCSILPAALGHLLGLDLFLSLFVFPFLCLFPISISILHSRPN